MNLKEKFQGVDLAVMVVNGAGPHVIVYGGGAYGSGAAKKLKAIDNACWQRGDTWAVLGLTEGQLHELFEEDIESFKCLHQAWARAADAFVGVYNEALQAIPK